MWTKEAEKAEDISIDVTEIDKRAETAYNDNMEFECLLNDYKPFLLSRVSQLVGSPGSRVTFEDMLSEAYLAFYESVKSYDISKGHFFSFMYSIVQKRLIDQIRKNYAKQVVTVSLENDDAEDIRESAHIAAVSIDAYEAGVERGYLVEEIAGFKQELAEWGITLDNLVAHSPKHAKTRSQCRAIIDAVKADDEILQIMWVKRYYPVKKIIMLTKMSPKIVKSARIFIIASLIILAGNYDYLRRYVTDE
jgi:RNA polymerase sigma factor